MFIAIRAITYATLFIGVFLVYVPASLLSRAGITPSAESGVAQIAGLVLTGAGAALALWCIVTLVARGRGTPAPFDPPRALVVVGPYRFVRNPMYVGAIAALLGAALFWESAALLSYAGIFAACAHLFVIGLEEPQLRRTFAHAYDDYCRHVGRWWPRAQQNRD